MPRGCHPSTIWFCSIVLHVSGNDEIACTNVVQDELLVVKDKVVLEIVDLVKWVAETEDVPSGWPMQNQSLTTAKGLMNFRFQNIVIIECFFKALQFHFGRLLQLQSEDFIVHFAGCYCYVIIESFSSDSTKRS